MNCEAMKKRRVACKWHDHLFTGFDAYKQVMARVVRHEPISPDGDGGRQMDGVDGPKPIRRPEDGGELGNGQIDRTELQAAEQARQFGDLVVGLIAQRLGEELGHEQHRATPDRLRGVGDRIDGEQRTDSLAKWVPGRRRVDQHVGVEGVHRRLRA